MNEFRARFTWSGEELLPFLEGLTANRIFAVQHDADEEVNRTHVHVYLEGVNIDKEGQKKRLMKDLGFTRRPNRDMWAYGMEPTRSVRGYIVYMLKGKLEPFYVRGEFTENLDECRSEWVDPSPRNDQKIQYKLRIENPVQSKARQLDLMDQVLKRYIENDKKDLIKIIRDVVYVEHKTIVGRYKVRDYVDYVRAHATPESWIKSMEKFCLFPE